ncbi:uncharacterized protein LOC114517816 [Dendronephthya gigantea]|uniref:uncharacterized protein LOC114517816 n=1 Tax=Dendronephthya gigantea TaxID=151771 RepID=UPI00106D2C17|nr:uncharacterized protein LOC114517816 [Dendronephthya gigantea]
MPSSTSGEQLVNSVPEDNTEGEDKLLKRIRNYCWLTGQYWSAFGETAPNTKPKRFLYGLWKVMMGIFALIYFAYMSANVGSSINLDQLSVFFFYYPVSTIESIVWEFRWLVTCLMGILVTPSIWKELFDNNKGKLHNAINIKWIKNSWLSWILPCDRVVLVMWLLSEIAILREISSNFGDSITPSKALRFSIDAILTLVDRIIALPLFFLLCITIYTLGCMVEEYCNKIIEWEIKKCDGASTSKGEETSNAQKESENSAREEFRKIKVAIRTAGLKFELFLTVHFVLLVCTFFLGICSCFEESEVKIPMSNSTRTVLLPFQIPQSARFVDLGINVSHRCIYTTTDKIYDIGKPITQSKSLTRAEKNTNTGLRNAANIGKHATNGANNSLSLEDEFEELRYELIKRSVASAWILMAVRTIESFVLYILPLALMARLQNRLRRIYEVIEDCNLKEQKDNGYLFDNVEVIRRMCKYVKTAHGFRIYGYTLPTFETFFLAAFMPFITATIQLLLCHIHMKEG